MHPYFQERKKQLPSRYQNPDPEPDPEKRTSNIPDARKSAVWQYFSRKDRDKVTCNICQREFTSHQKATGAMQR